MALSSALSGPAFAEFPADADQAQTESTSEPASVESEPAADGAKEGAASDPADPESKVAAGDIGESDAADEAPAESDAAEKEASPGDAESVQDAEIVEMEAVTVTADAPRAIAPMASERSAEELDDLPTAGDPFEAVRYEDAVVEEATLVDPGYSLIDTVMGFTRKNRAFSVYGADSDFNSYYFDFIRIPMNKHAQVDAPVVSTWMIEGMETVKGIAPLERGPGIGGTFIAKPIGQLEKPREFIVSPSTSLFGFSWKQSLGGDSGFALGASKSLSELYEPFVLQGYKILYDWMGMPFLDQAKVIPSYGDLCARLFYKKGAHGLNADLLGFYDLSIMDLDMAGRYDASGEALPYFVAGGAEWTFKPDGPFSNAAYAYASWQDRESTTVMDLDVADYLRESYRRMGLSEEEIAAAQEEIGSSITGSLTVTDHPRIHILAAEGGEKASWRADESLSFDLGANLRYAAVDGEYDGATVSDLKIMGVPFMNENYEVSGVTMSDSVLKAHAFARGTYDVGYLYAGLGAGATWLPLHDSALPSVEAECAWEASERFSLGGRAGWSAAYYDEFAFAERRLNEEILDTESLSSYGDLPRSVAAAMDALYALDARNALRLEPYGAFYYDLSGLALYASWRDPYSGDTGGDLFEQTATLDPDIGCSLGATIGWEAKLKADWSSSLSLTAASTRYRSRSDGSWFRSNSDTPLALKFAVMRRREKGTEFTGTLNCYAGKPFTPEAVASPGVLEKEAFNSAADWVPRASLGLNVKWDSTFMNLKGRYEFNCVNLLAFFSPTLAGMNEAAMETPGSSTRNFGNRQYNWFNTDLLTLVSSMKLKLGGTYFF